MKIASGKSYRVEIASCQISERVANQWKSGKSVKEWSTWDQLACNCSNSKETENILAISSMLAQPCKSQEKLVKWKSQVAKSVQVQRLVSWKYMGMGQNSRKARRDLLGCLALRKRSWWSFPVGIFLHLSARCVVQFASCPLSESEAQEKRLQILSC